MNTIKLTTKQFDNLLKTLPVKGLDYQVNDDPVRNTFSIEGVPRYFEYEGKSYLEVL